MKISVIIPIYNVSRYIERCLISALNQTYSDIEYVLVNDATPDDSMTIVESLIRNHPRKENVVIVSHEQNQGLSAARNTGIRHATGVYIFFLDSDDELPLDSIENLTFPFKSKNPDFVIGELEVVGSNRADFPRLRLSDNSYCRDEKIMHHFLCRNWYEMAWNKLIKKTLFAESNCWFYEGILHEDNLWSFQLALRAQSMVAIKKKTYIYHIQNQSITQKKTKKNIDSLYSVISEMICISQKENLLDKYEELVDYLDNLRIYYMKSLCKSNFDKVFIHQQIDRIDKLFQMSIRKKRNPSMNNLLKDKMLSYWINLTK